MESRESEKSPPSSADHDGLDDLWAEVAEEHDGAPIPEPPPPPQPRRRRRRRGYDPAEDECVPILEDDFLEEINTLEDALSANTRVMRAWALGQITKKQAETFSKLISNIVQVRKAQAFTMSVEGAGEPPDMTLYEDMPDIEAVRPVIVTGMDFGTLSDDERELFFRNLVHRRSGNGNGGNGHG